MISLPTRSTALRSWFCSALLGAAALALPAQAAELTPGKISSFSLSETSVDALETFRDGPKSWTEMRTTGKTTVKLTLDLGVENEEYYEWLPLDLDSVDAETPFSIQLGGLSYEGVLGDDPTYTKGKKSAFIPANFDEVTEKPIGTNGIKLSWTSTKLTVSILRSDADIEDFGSVWADTLNRAGQEKTQTSVRFSQAALRVSFGNNSSSAYYGEGILEEGAGDLPVYLTGTVKTTSKTVYDELLLLDSVTVTGGLDTTPPTITLTPPKGGFKPVDGMVTITGKVSDKHALDSVYFYAPTLGYAAADVTITKGAPEGADEFWWGPTEATWTATLPIEMGVNELRFDARDQSYQRKSISTEVFDTIPPQFIGRWDGLVDPVPENASGGYLTLTVSPKGAVSGKITLEGGISKSFKGIWHGVHFHAAADEGKASEISIDAYIPDQAGRVATADSDIPSAPQMVVQVYQWADDKASAGPLIRIPYSSANKLPADSPYIGRFNASMARPSDTVLGNGFHSLVVTNTGAVTVAGRLADGTVFTAAAGLGQYGQVMYFTPVYKTGFVESSQVINSENRQLDGGMAIWSRPAKFTDKQFPEGFEYGLEIEGQLYTPPAANSRVLNLGSDDAYAGWDGDLAGDGGGRDILVTTKHKITAPTDAAFKATVDPKTGLITGSFKISTTPALTATYSALIVGNSAPGFYVAPAEKGQTVKNFGSFGILRPKK